MKCTQCGNETVADAVFCHQCGRPVGDLAGDMNAKQRFAAVLSQDGDDDEREQILWQGKFSPRAMIGSWAAAAVFSFVMLVVAIVMKFNGTAWLISMAIVALLWLGLGGLMLYRQVSIHYYLTNQRILHERGVLWREVDRIEAIDIDDVAFVQGPVERMFGVGKIRVKSSDISTPEFELLGIEDARNVATMIDEVRRQERRKRGIHIESV